MKTWKMNKFEEGQPLNDVASVCWGSVVTQTDDVDIPVKNWSALFSSLLFRNTL